MELVATRFTSATIAPSENPVNPPNAERDPLVTAAHSTMHARPQTKLERALEAWKAGHQSVRALAAALTTEQQRVSNDEAYRLICQLDAKGLITRQKRTIE